MKNILSNPSELQEENNFLQQFSSSFVQLSSKISSTGFEEISSTSFFKKNKMSGVLKVSNFLQADCDYLT
jgi:hypothetical protein